MMKKTSRRSSSASERATTAGEDAFAFAGGRSSGAPLPGLQQRQQKLEEHRAQRPVVE